MIVDINFQTPKEVCRYMVSLLPAEAETVLEPTPGLGNLVRALAVYDVTAPEDYFLLNRELKFDAVVMNPPFSQKTADITNMPEDFCKGGMQFGYKMLADCMTKSDNIIALIPWFTISDSDVRLRALKKFGLISVTALPRKTFQYARIQTCILQMKKDYKGHTEFKVYDLLNFINHG